MKSVWRLPRHHPNRGVALTEVLRNLGLSCCGRRLWESWEFVRKIYFCVWALSKRYKTTVRDCAYPNCTNKTVGYTHRVEVKAQLLCLHSISNVTQESMSELRQNQSLNKPAVRAEYRPSHDWLQNIKLLLFLKLAKYSAMAIDKFLLAVPLYRTLSHLLYTDQIQCDSLFCIGGLAPPASSDTWIQVYLRVGVVLKMLSGTFHNNPSQYVVKLIILMHVFWLERSWPIVDWFQKYFFLSSI